MCVTCTDDLAVCGARRGTRHVVRAVERVVRRSHSGERDHLSELFNLNGNLMRLNQGQIVPVTINDLLEIIHQHIAIKELVNRGTESKPNFVVEYIPYMPDPKTARALFASERREGGLLPRVTKI
jgi:hypothetical protein